MRFAGCEGGPGARFEVFVAGQEVRQASHQLGSFCPRLDRDLASLNPWDGGEPESAGPLQAGISRAALVSDQGQQDAAHLLRVYPEARALIFSGGLTSAVAWGDELGESRVYALGGRAYSKDQRDKMRRSQRLLPLHDLDLTAAAHTAVWESGEAPLWIRCELDLLKPHLAPGVEPVASGGASIKAVRLALAAIPGQRVVGFEVVGLPGTNGRYSLVALTGAELLRDNILTWWCP